MLGMAIGDAMGARYEFEPVRGFNRGGKWPLAFAAMLAGTFLICLGIMALQNL